MLALQFISSSAKQFSALNSSFCRLCAFLKRIKGLFGEPTFCNREEIMVDETDTQISILSDELKNCDVPEIPRPLGLP